MRIGIVGCGMVGGALLKAVRQKGFKAKVLDPFKPDINDGMAVLDSDILFVCVPTPTVSRVQELHSLHNVLGVLSSENFKGVVAIKSTVLPGTTHRMAETYKNLRLCHNPEFLREKTAFKDTIEQPAILVGYDLRIDADVVCDFWRKFDPDIPVLIYPSQVTEMAKYMHNLFLATKVSFFNEMFEVCEKVGANYEECLEAALAIGKIGESHTKVPGHETDQSGKPLRGFGGACFPKDTKAFEWMCQLLGVRTEVLSGAINGNQRRRSDV